MAKPERNPWRVQWHVAPDGTVIQQRKRGEGAHEQLFQTFETTRPVTVAELDALSGEHRQELRRLGAFGVLWYLGMAVFFGGITLAGGLFTRSVSGELVPGLIVGAVAASALSVPAFRLVMVFLVRGEETGSAERLWHDAGLTSSTGVTISGAEARALIESPGTVSGAESVEER